MLEDRSSPSPAPRGSSDPAKTLDAGRYLHAAEQDPTRLPRRRNRRPAAFPSKPSAAAAGVPGCLDTQAPIDSTQVPTFAPRASRTRRHLRSRDGVGLARGGCRGSSVCSTAISRMLAVYSRPAGAAAAAPPPWPSPPLLRGLPVPPEATAVRGFRPPLAHRSQMSLCRSVVRRRRADPADTAVERAAVGPAVGGVATRQLARRPAQAAAAGQRRAREFHPARPSGPGCRMLCDLCRLLSCAVRPGALHWGLFVICCFLFLVVFCLVSPCPAIPPIPLPYLSSFFCHLPSYGGGACVCACVCLVVGEGIPCVFFVYFCAVLESKTHDSISSTLLHRQNAACCGNYILQSAACKRHPSIYVNKTTHQNPHH